MANFRPPYHQSYGGGRKVEFLGDHAAGIDMMYVARSRSHDPPSTFRTVRAPSSSALSLMPSVTAWLEDPEMKRRKRLTKYKIYSLEGKMKISFKKGYRWIKRKCHRIVHGY
ncbi:hypothetical protein Nepgr_001605 [Nepenthes gracilis]|uniref:Uncharacterized protein n=1 Tax=Nepenthes gracilis TaxID=150966 RepID=A0AAD3RXL6_NEPGR|nr:hypothetical protein Nepgr_001605 [Nepenthes gracilis]